MLSSFNGWKKKNKQLKSLAISKIVYAVYFLHLGDNKHQSPTIWNPLTFQSAVGRVSFPNLINHTMAPFRLDHKVAVISGAGSGIGKQTAIALAEHGARVYILDLSLEHAEATAVFIREHNGAAEAHRCDVSNQEEVINTLHTIHAKTPINILINNAGIGFVGNLEQTAEQDFERLYQVNVKGVYNGMYAAVPLLKANGGGVILNMASIAASSAIPDRFAYMMSKGAVLTMTYSVAQDYLTSNIRCNCISPARVHTPFVDAYLQKNYPGKEIEMLDKLAKNQPIGRMATPREVAYLALYLCSDEAAFITGCDYPIDGGFTNLSPI
jgi:NAD(P)-dependent dehydrogenase (short-subunit alcohol dehydrogenase family)